MHKRLLLSLAVLLGIAAPLWAQPAAPPAAATPVAGAAKAGEMPAPPGNPGANMIDLPVTKAVLFSSGVGYFEHAGTVEGDATLRLMFKTEQINDVLKSMVLRDLDKGTVASVTYGSNDPIGRTLRSFGVDISQNPTLPDLLNQLRGAGVTISVPDKVSGSILNVEARTKVVGQPPTQITEHVLNIVTDAGIRAIPLESINSLTLADGKLRDELNQALALLATSRDTERKPVDIRFTGTGKRRVMVGYLVETPVWKASYRLDLTNAGEKDKKPVLQGWAIVENTSETDWKGVELWLMSGRPISFIQDLYTPLYVPRPVVVPEMYASLRPKVYDEGLDADQKMEKLAEAAQAQDALQALDVRGEGKYARDGATSGRALDKARMAPSAPAAVPTGGGGGWYERSKESASALGLGDMSTAAQGGKLGELFKFQVPTQVDLARRRSAMLPLVNADIDAEKVSIYNQATLPKNPLNGVYLTNSTPDKLPGGPITVYDGGAYAGDAQIDHLEPRDKRLLSYAIDLNVTVDPSVSSTNRIVSAKVVGGVLEIGRVTSYTQLYKIKNKADKDRTLIIEHPFVNGRDLVEPKTFEEKTPGLYRFRVVVKAGVTGEFTVKEDQPQGETVSLLGDSVNAFLWYSTSTEIAEPVRKALKQAIDLKQALAQAQRTLQQLENELNAIKGGQDRLRKNIETVGKDTPQGKRFLDKLSEQEDRIEELEGKKGQKGLIESARDDVNKKQKDLESYLKDLNVKG